MAVPVAGSYAFSSFYNEQNTLNGRVTTTVNGANVGTTAAATGAIQRVTLNLNLAAGANTFAETSDFNIDTNPGSLDVDDFGLVLLMAAVQNVALTAPNLVGLAHTQNQRAVATGLTNAFNTANLGTIAAPNGNAGAIVTALNNTNPAAIPGVLDSLSGEGIAATQNLAHRSAELFTSSIFDETTFYGSDRAGATQLVLPAPPPGSVRPLGSFQALAPASGSGADTLKVQPIRELADLPAARPQFIEAAPAAPTRTWRAWGTGFGASEDVRSNAAIGVAVGLVFHQSHHPHHRRLRRARRRNGARQLQLT